MYSLFLVGTVALLILSPLALELWLTVVENRRERRRVRELAQANGFTMAWASDRVA